MALMKRNNNIFKAKELRNQLGLSEKDIRIIKEYQEKFPILVSVDEYKEGDFVVDLEDLWKSLEVKSKLYDWRKKVISELELEEEVDYIETNFCDYKKSCKNKRGGHNKKQYLCTIDVAKDILLTQTKSSISKNVRDYFKLIEKCLREKVIWNTIRADEKELANEFKSAFGSYLLQYKITTVNDPLFDSYIAFGWDILNIVALGKTARKLKEERKILDKQTRDNLLVEDNKRLLFAQDRALVGMRAGVEPQRFITFLANEIENKFGVNYYEEINALNRQYTPLFSRRLATN